MSVDADFTAFVSHLKSRVRGRPAGTPLPAEPLAGLCEVTGGAGAEQGRVVERFLATAQTAGARPQRIAAEGWAAAIVELLRGLPARTVHVQAEDGAARAAELRSALTPERAGVLRGALEAAGIHVAPRPDDETLFSVDASITGVRLAVAETGSLVCASGPQAARGASLIPPVHVAVVGESQVVADLFDAFAALGARIPPAQPGVSAPAYLPANVNFITGPSKTADIEGVLVTGVHGPGAVHVMVVGGW